jgi:hypothetical protein
MGFLDSILGKSNLPESKTEKLFAISTAAVTMDANLGLKSDGAAAICFKPMESSAYDSTRKEIEDLLKISTKETGSQYSVQKDEYNYLWVVLKDIDFDDLVTNIQMVSQTLTDEGFGTHSCVLFSGSMGPQQYTGYTTSSMGRTTHLFPSAARRGIMPLNSG